MVYETDFYTTRRPYVRPTITSYSVTRREVPWHKVPTVPRPSQVPPCFTVFGSRHIPGQTFHRNIPHIAHKRLAIVTPSAHTIRLKQSAYLGEIDRIYHKVRPSLAYQPVEDYLNSRSMVSFDDETRSIRAKTAEILKRIHTPIPRAQRPMPLPGELDDQIEIVKIRLELLNLRLLYFPREIDYIGLLNDKYIQKNNIGFHEQKKYIGAYYSHSELPITDRISSDNYISRLLSANKEVQHNVLTMSHYDEPARHYNNIGKGHLACVSFAGGRPISKRRNLASDDYIRDDINVLSHYGRFRAAAEGVPHIPDTEYAPLPHRPPTKSSVTGSWKSNAPHRPERAEEHHINANLTAGEEFDAALERKKKRREAVEAAAYREADEEKRRKQELQRQEELAQQAAIDRQEELERKSQEEARKLKEEEERIARENEERLEAERKAKEDEERLLKEEEERLAKEEEERLAKEEAEKKAEKEKKAAKKKAEEEKKRKEEEERKAKEEAEKKAKEEEERKAKEEAERKAKEEEERKAKEEAERLAKEEEERKAKEEAERLAKEEEERKAKEEAERLAKEEEERLAKEEEERLAQEATDKVEETTDAETVNADESGPEPVVEEPLSPEEPPPENTEPSAVEEVDEDEEEEEE